MWREDWHSTPHSWMIRRSGCVCGILLSCWACGIRAIIIIGRGWPLGGRLMRHTAHRSSTSGSRITAGRIVFPHVNTALRRTRQFAYVVDRCIIGSRVRMISALSHKLAFRKETPLRTVAGNDGTGNAYSLCIVSLLYVVIRWRFVHAYEIRPTNLRRCTWV